MSALFSFENWQKKERIKKNKEKMSYCKKKGIEPTVCYCLACEYCLPPSKRIGGRMCENEVMDKED